MFCYALFLVTQFTYSDLRLHPAITDRCGKMLNKEITVKESPKFMSELKCKLSLHACAF